jgi:hypothetical protein
MTANSQDSAETATPSVLPPLGDTSTADAESEVLDEIPRRRGCLGRLGCGALLVIWLFFVMLPTFLLILAIQGELGLWHGGDIPEPEAHPMILVRLLMDIDNQGFSVTTSSIVGQTETNACVQTHVRFLLWEGEGEDVSYCDCYERASENTAWLYNASTPGLCEG